MPVESADDLAVFFDIEEFGVSALYRGSGVEPLSIGVIHDQPTDEAQFGKGAVVIDTHFMHILRSNVGSPAAGDILEFPNGGIFVLMGEPSLDRSGTVWRCEARELPA